MKKKGYVFLRRNSRTVLGVNPAPRAKARGFMRCGVNITLSILMLLAACCSPRPRPGPEPLTGFSEKVTALVTTSVRIHLRGDKGRQEILRRKLSSLEKKTTMSQLIDELKAIEKLKELTQPIETDVIYELKKLENQEIHNNFNSSEIQREVVSAIVLGMKRALNQLEGVNPVRNLQFLNGTKDGGFFLTG